MKRLMIAILPLCIITSCGPTAEQKAAIENQVIARIKAQQDSTATAQKNEQAIKDDQKRHDDSIANSVAKTYQDKETAEAMNTRYNTLQQTLINCDAQLAVLNDRKNKDAEFHFGRSTHDREQQLSSDQRNIDNLKLSMMNIRSQMQALKAKMGSGN